MQPDLHLRARAANLDLSLSLSLSSTPEDAFRTRTQIKSAYKLSLSSYPFLSVCLSLFFLSHPLTHTHVHVHALMHTYGRSHTKNAHSLCTPPHSFLLASTMPHWGQTDETQHALRREQRSCATDDGRHRLHGEQSNRIVSLWPDTA